MSKGGFFSGQILCFKRIRVVAIKIKRPNRPSKFKPHYRICQDLKMIFKEHILKVILVHD